MMGGNRRTPTKDFLSFFVARYRPFLIGAATLFVVAVIVTLAFTEVTHATLTLSVVEAIDFAIGFATVLIAGLVFVGEAREQWVAQLPLRLTVYFIQAGNSTDPSSPIPARVRMVVEEAYLAHEGDIRTWASQLGAQMMGGRGLQLGLMHQHRRLGIEVDGTTVFMHHAAIFVLRDAPDLAEEARTALEIDLGSDDWCIRWRRAKLLFSKGEYSIEKLPLWAQEFIDSIPVFEEAKEPTV